MEGKKGVEEEMGAGQELHWYNQREEGVGTRAKTSRGSHETAHCFLPGSKHTPCPKSTEGPTKTWKSW